MGSESYLEKIRPKPEDKLLPNPQVTEEERVADHVAKLRVQKN